MSEYGFEVKELSAEEQHVLCGGPLLTPEDDAGDLLVPSEDVW